MGMLVSPYRHATVGGGTSVFGALARAAAGQGFTTTTYDVLYSTEIYDYNAWHSTSSNTERFTAITGATLVRVIANANSGADDRLSLTKNGAAFYGQGHADLEAFVNIASAPTAAVPSTDYFSASMTHNTALNGLGSNEQSWLSIEMLSSSLRYALVYKSATQSMTGGAFAALSFNSEVADTSAFHDTVTNNSRLSVPVGGPTLVRICANVKTQDAAAAAQTLVSINKNGASARGLPASDNETTSSDHLNVFSAPIAVTPGTDYFEVIVFVTNNTTVDSVESTWASIEEVTDPYCLVYKTGGTQSFTGGAAAAAVSWDAEVADALSAHDTVTNNSRITVPSGKTWARPCFNLKTASTAGLMEGRVRKNAANYDGMPYVNTDTAGTDNLNAVGAWVQVTPGDYFEVFFSCGTTTTLGTDNETWFCVEFKT